MRRVVVSIKNVSKSYGKNRVLKNVSLNIEEATCFGILGPNGAGKTTLVKMLYGMCKRDAGKDSSITVFGYDPACDGDKIRYISGIVGQSNNLDRELNVWQNLRIYAGFYGIGKSVAMQRIKELLDFMDIGDKMYSEIKTLSGGMKRRLVIARALINNPRLLILDEPTTGLDPHVRHIIWDKIHALRKSGTTIIITTHYMEEAFTLCDNLIMLNHGEKVLEGRPDDLIKKNVEPYVLEIYGDLSNISYGVRVEKTQERTLVFANKMDVLENIMQGINGRRYYLRQANLEDVFLSITGRGLHE